MRLATLLLLAAAGASADGAFPAGAQVLARDAQHLYAGTTFGLVFTEDGGASWHYVCEPYVTGDSSFVILYSLGASGSVLALANHLRRSTDSGCTWQTTPEPAGATLFRDIFGSSLAVAWNASGSALWRSHDDGQTFSEQIFTTAEKMVSVESAGAAIYATTANFDSPDAGGAPPALFRSADSGATWQRTALPIGPPADVRILLVAPEDPKKIWLRAINALTNADDLLFSSDGGQSFTALLHVARGLSGFARGADGTLFVSDLQAGALALPPGAASFTRLVGPHLLCLAFSGGRLYGCADGLQDSYNLAASDDSGQSWKPLLAFSQIQGPSSCVQTQCAQDWIYQQRILGAGRSSSTGCGCNGAGGGAEGILLLLLLGRLRPGRGCAGGARRCP